jgi:hypothetical protein
VLKFNPPAFVDFLGKTLDDRHGLPWFFSPKRRVNVWSTQKQGRKKALRPNVFAGQKAFFVELRRFELLTSSHGTAHFVVCQRLVLA